MADIKSAKLKPICRLGFR